MPAQPTREHDRSLAPALVGDAHDHGIRESRLVAQHALDRAERHLEPAGDDDVVAATGHGQGPPSELPASAVRNQRAPSAMTNALVGQLVVVEVALGEARPAELHLAVDDAHAVVPIGRPS